MRPTRFLNFKQTPWWVFFAGAFAAIIFLQAAFARPVLDMMLLDGVRTSSAKWANHFIDEMAQWTFPVTSDGVDHTHQSDQRIRLVGAVGAALETGTIHQIDLVRLDCMCAVSLGQGLPESQWHNKLSIDGALHSLFDGEIPEGRVIGFGDELIEMDAAILNEVTTSGKPNMTLLPSGQLAAAVFRSTNPNQPDLLVRLVIDLTDHKNSLQLLLGLLSIVLTTISGLVIFLATRAISRSQRKGEMSEEQARFLAERCSLTGLYNRLGFRNRAEDMLAECRSNGTRACLIQYDADNLKSINDLHGHPTGDRALESIAQKLEESFPKGALIARLGSDEFAVLIEERHMSSGLEPLKASALDAAERKLVISTSAGFAFFPTDGDTLFQLMQAADLALIGAKKTSQNGIIAFHSSMNDAFRKKAWEIQGIREALKFGQLEPYYQPLFNAKTMKLAGIETLVRWNHPNLGTLAPGFFETALADPAVAVDVTRRMLDLSLQNLGVWWAEGYRFSTSLNVGEYDLRNADLLSMIDTALETHNLPHEALIIEVTESAVNAANVKTVLPVLEALRSRGLFVALDDFGTGTSSLTLLRSLPRTAIKIDKSFVHDMVHDEGDLSIVRALTGLGHDLGIKVVAEGVEDEEQAELLRELGVDVFQGFLYGKPVPASDISLRLKELRADDLVIMATSDDVEEFDQPPKLKRAGNSRLG